MYRFHGFSARLCGLLALAAALSSCGGGGGGGHSSSTGVLTYFANFTPGTGTGPTGQSEEVQVVQANGTVIADQFLNTGAGTQQLTFKKLPNVNLYVYATLYAGTGGVAGGSAAQGVASAYISGGTASIMSTSIQQPIVSVAVAPSTPAVNIGSTFQLVAQPLDANQNIVFQSAPIWSTGNSGVATVGTTGLVTGVAQGQATIGASYGGTLTASSTVSVSASSNPTAQWTIMLYLNAANSLDTASMPNVQQIEQIAGGSNVNFIIQWKLTNNTGISPATHPFNGTRRYQAKRYTGNSVLNGLNLIQDLGSGIDMGSYQTLNSFITWSEQTYPANHYALILWDHGNGWRTQPAIVKKGYRGISYDDEFQNSSTQPYDIDVWQLGAAIGSNHLDILSFDACLMQMIEVEDEVVGRADYMVCAEDNTPGPGYPYNTAFAQFYSNPTGSVPTLASGIVDAFMAFYEKSSSGYSTGPLSQSVIDLSKAPAVVGALDTFSQALLAQGASIGSTVSAVRSASIPYDAEDTYYFYDLGSISRRFATYPGAPSAVASAASALNTAVQNSVVHSAESNSADSTGLSIEFASEPTFESYAQYYVGGVIPYDNLQVAQHTHWLDVLTSPTVNPAP